MPAQWQRDGIDYHRPLLGVSASDIRAWLAARAVPFIEDPTNADEKFTRNRIRARILPVLQEVFPHFRRVPKNTAVDVGGKIADAKAIHRRLWFSTSFQQAAVDEKLIIL